MSSVCYFCRKWLSSSNLQCYVFHQYNAYLYDSSLFSSTGFTRYMVMDCYTVFLCTVPERGGTSSSQAEELEVTCQFHLR